MCLAIKILHYIMNRY